MIGEPFITLEDLIALGKKLVDDMSEEQKTDMLRKQAKSWAASEAQWARDFAEGKCERD